MAQRALNALLLLMMALVTALVGGWIVLAATQASAIATVSAWHPDTVIAWVLTETGGPAAGHDVIDGSYGFFSVLWFDALTEWLPGHRAVWALQPAATALATAGAIGLATARAAGRAAGALAAAMALCVGAEALLVSLQPTTHGPTYLAVALLGAFTVELTRPAPFGGRRRLIAAAGLMTLVLAVHLTDDLLWILGIVPCAAALGAWAATARDRAARRAVSVAAMVVTAAVAGWVAVEAGMSAAGYRQMRPLETGLIDSLADIGPGVERLSRLVVDVGGGLPGGVVVALGAVLPACLLVASLRGRPHHPAVVVHLVFWGVAAAALAGAVVLTRVEGVRFGVPFVLAAGAVVPVLARWGRAGRAVALGCAALAVGTALSSLVRFDAPARASTIRATTQAIEQTSRSLGAATGFGDYYLGSNVTWATEGEVVSRPVADWVRPGALCPFPVAVDASWYVPTGARRSFLLWPGDPPPPLGRPLRSVEVGRDTTMHVYEGDIATQLCGAAGALATG